MQTVYIYAISRKGTSDSYIGSSITPKVRWVRHRSNLKLEKHHSDHLQRAWKKYGADAFAFELLEKRDCASHADRIAFELAWIAKRGTYNVMLPSEGNTYFKRSTSSIAKGSASLQEKRDNDPDYAAFLAQRGAEMAAQVRTAEGRANMAEHTKRRWKDPEERKRLRAGLVKRWEDPANHEKQAELGRIREADPKVKAAHAARTKALWDDPVVGARYREAGKIRWADPEAKARQAEKMRTYHARRRAAKDQ